VVGVVFPYWLLVIGFPIFFFFPSIVNGFFLFPLPWVFFPPFSFPSFLHLVFCPYCGSPNILWGSPLCPRSFLVLFPFLRPLLSCLMYFIFGGTTLLASFVLSELIVSFLGVLDHPPRVFSLLLSASAIRSLVVAWGCLFEFSFWPLSLCLGDLLLLYLLLLRSCCPFLGSPSFHLCGCLLPSLRLPFFLAFLWTPYVLRGLFSPNG